ncbi:hypothetical protein HHI36_015763 [Cryptolaemus montrouzieri]|uniref:HMG box domain-containing protein n=1 Tax=Cryptolaemus montrouzieri TaxID=559131 RepID=A0ABD2N6H4_9CUCU
MGSKKNKKTKKEEPQVQEVVEIVASKRNLKRKLVPEDEVTEVVEIIDDYVPKTSKKKKKSKTSVDLASTESNDVGYGEVLKNGVKDEAVKDETLDFTEIDMKSEVNDSIEDKGLFGKKEITMPQNDLLELLRRMEVLIPANDSLSYRSRTEKLNWDDIAFSHYSVSDCKGTWELLKKKIRRYRVLSEVLTDAKEYVTNPPKTKRIMFPGMPPKPLSSYQLFYRKKKPSLLAETPGLDIGEISRQISQMFKNLSPEKKAKYDKLAAQAKAKYDEELQAFYESHPDVKRLTEKNKRVFPMKPRTPFVLYFENQMRKSVNSNNNDIQAKNSLREQCREQWKQLSMKKKVLWITKAEEDLARYEEEVKQYTEGNPNFVPISVKHILSKDDIALKERYSGKPDKPPNSAYSLFSKIMLQSSEVKLINAKDRMNFIATQWKNCSEEDKNMYKNQANELTEQYKKDYKKYLESLPEDKKQLELQKKAPRKRQKPENPEESPKKKPVAKKGKAKRVPEPPTPPISAFRYFANTNSFDDKAAKKAWKKLSEEERNNYEKKLVEIKREYILEFEKFLNSLSKEELEEYSKTKQQLKISSDDFVDEDSSSSSSSSSDQSDEDSD